MRGTREEVKAALLATAEGMIDEYLDRVEGEEPTLADLEEIILKLRKRVGQEMGEIVLERQEARQPVQRPRCPGCGEEMSYKGMKPVTVETRLGLLEFKRAYYYCDRCRSGLFPPG